MAQKRKQPASEGSASAGTEAACAEALYRVAALIRAAELKTLEFVNEGSFGGLWHPGLGQEGLQAGAVSTLGEQDYLFYTHRGPGGPIAKGMPLEVLFADLLARATGSSGGKGGGTPHFAWPERGVMGLGGTLGTGFVMGAGTALASKIRGDDRVTLVMFGEGTASRGPFHECALEAAIIGLPVVWLCENNGWALSAPFAAISPTAEISGRAAAYGMPGVEVDGQDPMAVQAAVAEAVDRARSGGGPSLIEAKTVRLRGHYEGDQQQYRDDLAADLEGENDPLRRLGPLLDQTRVEAIDEEVAKKVDVAFQAALDAPPASPDVIFEDVFA